MEMKKIYSGRLRAIGYDARALQYYLYSTARKGNGIMCPGIVQFSGEHE